MFQLFVLFIEIPKNIGLLCIESFAMDAAIAIIISLLLALFRYIGIHKKVRCTYVLDNIINTIL